MLMVADHLVDDEAQEFLGEVWVEMCGFGQTAQPCNLFTLAPRIGGRQAGIGLVPAHRLRHLEAFGQQEDERRIDIVDALPISPKRLVNHMCLPSKAIWQRQGLAHARANRVKPVWNRCSAAIGMARFQPKPGILIAGADP